MKNIRSISRFLVLLVATLWCGISYTQTITLTHPDSIKNLLVGTWEFQKTKPASDLFPGEDLALEHAEKSKDGTVYLVQFCDNGKFYDLEEYKGITTLKDSGFWYFESLFGFLVVERIVGRKASYRTDLPPVFDYIYLKAHGADTTWDIGDMFYQSIKIDTSDMDRKDTLFIFTTTIDTKWITNLNSEELKLDPPFKDSPMEDSAFIVYSFYYQRRKN